MPSRMEPRGPERASLRSRIAGSEFTRDFLSNPTAIAGAIILLFALLVVLVGPYVAPQNPYDLKELNLADAYKPPFGFEGSSSRFLLGTDNQGRDILSSLVYGCRISLFIGVVGVLISCVLGTTLGLLSGYYGGKLDSLIMRIADIELSFPSILIALFMMSVFGRGIDKLLIALTAVSWVVYARTVRGDTLGVKAKEYVEAARVIGLPDRVIMLRHILPNVTTSIIVLSTLDVGGFILAEATLSFLGVGVPVTKPSLGLLVKNGFDVLFSGYWWVAVFPGLFIMILIFGINLLGDFLKDQLNPRLK